MRTECLKTPFIPRSIGRLQDKRKFVKMEENKNNPGSDPQLNNPLHGVRLIDMLEYLVEKYGWKSLGTKISIRCFTHDPSIGSSLKFLRKTDWARAKVEALYIKTKERSRE
jgi:uncharacterized protein (DUF2132 family)